MAIVLAVAAFVSGVATYGAMTGWIFGPDPRLVPVLLQVSLVLLLILGAVIAAQLVRLWTERRRSTAGARLHTRIVVLFSLVAIIPAIVMAGLSGLFFNYGLQGWFSKHVSTAIRESMAVATAYVEEHRRFSKADVLAMANELNHNARFLSRDPEKFSEILSRLVELRSASEAMVVDSSGRVIGRSNLSFVLAFESIPQSALQKAAAGEVVDLTGSGDDRIRALVRLDNYVDAFLVVGRLIEPRVIAHVERVTRATDAYRKLEEELFGVKITFTLIFLVVSLLILLTAVWFGLQIASAIVRPVGAMVSAAERVREGDLSSRVPEGPSDDEIGTLSRAFNRMTSQLQSQQGELIEANRQLDHRRRFTETVLEGVSAGVIGLDPDGRINLPNRSAVILLDAEADQLMGLDFATAIPEMADLLTTARQKGGTVSGEARLVRRGQPHNLHVRVAAEWSGGELQGYVVTFDDVTELMSAQRRAAWADVARRIAHEIKNPLTPIQLSAERLKRKYLSEVTSDPDTFVRCTETIVRQVGDIGRMVDEFSSFARMPAPMFRVEDVYELVRQAVFLQRVAHSEIEYDLAFDETELLVNCDGRQVAQVLTNILQNAADAIAARPDLPSGEPLTDGKIEIAIERDEELLHITIADNGIGLPQEERHRLTEPYVTTREKGTGLGLAIVKKIMEEHGGGVVLADRPTGGARVTLSFAAAGAGSTVDPVKVGEGEAMTSPVGEEAAVAENRQPAGNKQTG